MKKSKDHVQFTQIYNAPPRGNDGWHPTFQCIPNNMVVGRSVINHTTVKTASPVTIYKLKQNQSTLDILAKIAGIQFRITT
jgi:hypothetical protein